MCSFLENKYNKMRKNYSYPMKNTSDHFMLITTDYWFKFEPEMYIVVTVALKLPNIFHFLRLN